MIEDASVTSQSWETRRALRSLTLVAVGSASSMLSSEEQEEIHIEKKTARTMRREFNDLPPPIRLAQNRCAVLPETDV